MKNPRLFGGRARITAFVFIASMLLAIGLRAGAIHDAAVAGDLNKVKALLAADPSLLESKDKDGNTPLLSACFAPPTYVPRDAVANYLIDQGANIKAANNWNGIPLYCAIKSPDLVQRLIAKGADVNARAFGANGLTPLQQAASASEVKTAKLLIDHGADLDGRSSDGTVLQNLIKRKGDAARDMVRLLLEGGAKRQEFSFGNTELHLAALNGSADVIRLLVEHGADVHAANIYQLTALFYAARHGYRRAADALIALGASPKEIVEANYGKAAQLNATLQPGEAYLWYLGGVSPGTGYAVKTKGHLLVFDPYLIDEFPEAALTNGCLNPPELAGQKITFLITRQARRAPGISALAKRFPDAGFVVGYQSAESPGTAGALPPYRFAAPHESFSLGDIQVHTTRATGRHYIEGVNGVGFLVECDGLKIYDAGLHASSRDAAEQARYRDEVDFLKPFGPVDIAILPIRGRHITIAYEPYLYLLDQLSPKAVYLIGDDLVAEEHKKCLEVLQARNVPVFYPEGGIATGERFHFVREQPAAPRPRETIAPKGKPAAGQRYVVPALDLELVWLASGAFDMGSEKGDGDTVPVTRVTLSHGFCLGKYEVTQGEYEAVTGANPSKQKGARLPVETVSWNDAMAFCQKLTEREKAAGRLPENCVYTLPTEAQWEYACRASTTGDFASPLAELGWYGSNSSGKTHPVGERCPNAWGPYDMHGNVWEWCLDQKRDHPGGAITDPTGPTTGSLNRVSRGGGAGSNESQCRSFRRSGSEPDSRFWARGFRLCLGHTPNQ